MIEKITKFENIENSDNIILASFDIESPFTNIPPAETIQIIMNQIDSTLLGIPGKLFETLLEFSVYNNLFMFNNKYYKYLLLNYNKL